MKPERIAGNPGSTVSSVHITCCHVESLVRLSKVNIIRRKIPFVIPVLTGILACLFHRVEYGLIIQKIPGKDQRRFLTQTRSRFNPITDN